MVGVNGGKFPAIRKHLDENIGAVYKDMDLSSAVSYVHSTILLIHTFRFDGFPEIGKIDPEACSTIFCSDLTSPHSTFPDKAAIDRLSPGDAIVIFTPDSMYTPSPEPIAQPIVGILHTGTHFSIAIYAIERGMHVLITKPATQLLSHHNTLIDAAKKHNVICFVEHHKR
jgi:D-galacturonate reductase